MNPRSILFLATAGVLILLLIVHTLLVVLSLTPDNPVKKQYQDRIQGYMDPLFTQNWKLFAPNPVSQHRSLAAQARIVDPRTGKTTESEWLDLSQPLIKQKQQNRLSSEALVTRYIISGIRDYHHRNEGRKQNGEKMLQRAASTALQQQWPEQEIQEIRFRTILQSVPPFDERHRDDDSMQREYHESEWLPFTPAAEEWP